MNILTSCKLSIIMIVIGSWSHLDSQKSWKNEKPKYIKKVLGNYIAFTSWKKGENKKEREKRGEAREKVWRKRGRKEEWGGIAKGKCKWKGRDSGKRRGKTKKKEEKDTCRLRFSLHRFFSLNFFFCCLFVSFFFLILLYFFL